MFLNLQEVELKRDQPSMDIFVSNLLPIYLFLFYVLIVEATDSIVCPLGDYARLVPILFNKFLKIFKSNC